MNQSASSNARSGIYAIWDERLTAAEREHIGRVSRFCDEHIVPLLQGNGATGPFSRGLIEKWGALGLPGLQTPAELGGLGASYFAKIAMVQELARRSFAAAFSLNNMQSLVLSIVTRGSPVVRDLYASSLLRGELVASVALTEPSGGSDLGAMQTTARQVEGGWCLNGEKTWIANAAIADLAVVSAQAGSGTKGIGRFIVDIREPGAERLAPCPVAAGHLVGLGGFRLVDYFVPDTHVMDPPGEAFRLSMQSINGARVHVAAMCVAVAQASLSTAIGYCRQRQAFGRRLLDHQGLRWKLVDVANQIEAANLLAFRAAELIEADTDATLAAAHAKKFAGEMAVEAIEESAQAVGANASLATYPFMRNMAEIKLAAYADGTTEMQNERIGSYLEKHYAG